MFRTQTFVVDKSLEFSESVYADVSVWTQSLAGVPKLFFTFTHSNFLSFMQQEAAL